MCVPRTQGTKVQHTTRLNLQRHESFQEQPMGHTSYPGHWIPPINRLKALRTTDWIFFSGTTVVFSTGYVMKDFFVAGKQLIQRWVNKTYAAFVQQQPLFIDQCQQTSHQRC